MNKTNLSFDLSPAYPRKLDDNEMLALIDSVYERVVLLKSPLYPGSLPDKSNDRAVPPFIAPRPRRKSGELGKAILNTLFNVGRSGMRLQDIADETNSTPGSVSGWIYNNGRRIPGLRKLSAGIYAYSSIW